MIRLVESRAAKHSLLRVEQDSAMAGPKSKIVIFDGTCVLCNGWVAFLLRHERDDLTRFATTQSAEGQELGWQFGFSASDMKRSFVVIDGDSALTKSDAALSLLTHLRRPYRWLQITRLVPRVVRDAVYDLIARNRYRWFGRLEECALPSSGQRHRFLQEVSAVEKETTE